MGNPKKIQKKQETVREIAQKLTRAKGIYLVDYKGMTVEQVNDLRRTFDKSGIEYKVVKNTLLYFAFKEVFPNDNIDVALKGTTGAAISYDDSVSPARVIKDFIKKYKLPQPKIAVVEGKVFDAKAVDRLAEVPSKEVLLSTLVASLQSPISSFVFALNGIISEFVYTVEAVKQKKANA
ncbi:TPA: 50S ribosomal protein L10 [candidate division WOR-3 bacterium]|jgi:large subunit ribosomal protein L10|uniref:Large ribosomal subunit protein uL10 n=1 Tax=candidate division WOR-3 bacterium TaxID=2052148 RepID=A0A350HCB9_UNCW3|nr:50S ribosomal protein L10 [candidate division WOR-3 bacterium]